MIILNKKQLQHVLIISLIIISIFFSIASISEYSKQEYNSRENRVNEIFNIKQLPKTANIQKKALNYSDLHQNATQIRRVFDSINFTLNASGFAGANFTLMQISFTNNTVRNFTMLHINYTTNFTYTYTPEYNAPLGRQNVSFFIFNKSLINVNMTHLLNNQTTFTNFTIKANCIAYLNNTELSRGESLLAQFWVNSSEFTWEIAVVDSDNESQQNHILSFGNNVIQILFEIDEKFTQADIFYYIKINLTDKTTSKVGGIYFKFRVLNAKPLILSSTFNYPNSIYRTKEFRISINVSDYEDQDPNDLTVTAELEDPSGDSNGYNVTMHNDDWYFYYDFTISASKPAGVYRVYIAARDSHNELDLFSDYITILNNPPVINGYKINDLPTSQSIRIKYGEDLVFTFNVSDLEGLSYVKVALRNERNEWYNITEVYTKDVSITVRTVELITGKWLVYIFVIDTDGVIVGLDFGYDNAPQEIEIIPDTLGDFLPLFSLIVGIILGLLFGFIVGLFWRKSKTPPLKDSELKEKSLIIMKPAKKKRSEPQTIAQKRKEIGKKEILKETVDKKEPERITPQRKIKRKLK